MKLLLTALVFLMVPIQVVAGSVELLWKSAKVELEGKCQLSVDTDGEDSALKALELTCRGKRNRVPAMSLMDIRRVDISRMKIYDAPSIDDETLKVELITSVEIPFVAECLDGTKDASVEFLFRQGEYFQRQLRAGASGEMKGFSQFSDICAAE